ncbi:MAG: hypothetical protein ACRETI_08440 [Steroidobacteraceae bacterium]
MHPGQAVAGFLGFFLWAVAEAAQQALTLVAYRRWAEAYSTADVAAREVLRIQIETYDAVWDSMFLLLLFGFLIGNVLYGHALLRGKRFDRALGTFYFAAALLTIAGISGELGGPLLPASVGVWLWRMPDERVPDLPPRDSASRAATSLRPA